MTDQMPDLATDFIHRLFSLGRTWEPQRLSWWFFYEESWSI